MGYIYIQGEEIPVGSHGDTDYVFASGDPVPNSGQSDFVFESGTGLGGVAFVEDFEDQSWTDNFSIIQGTSSDFTIGTYAAYEGSYGLDIDVGTGESGRLGSNDSVPTFPIKFRYRVNIQNTSSDSEDGDFFVGLQDLDNYYQLQVKPQNTDNPMFRFDRREGSGSTAENTHIAGSTGANFGREEWLTIRGEIQNDGDCAFELDHSGGTERITGTVSDTSIFTQGQVGPRGYVRSYFDLIEVNMAQGGGALPDVV